MVVGALEQAYKNILQEISVHFLVVHYDLEALENTFRAELPQSIFHESEPVLPLCLRERKVLLFAAEAEEQGFELGGVQLVQVLLDFGVHLLPE